MVNNKIAQRAVAAGLSGLMAFGAAAPAALATGIDVKGMKWYGTNENDDGTYFKRLGGDDRYGTMKKIVEAYNDFTWRADNATILNGFRTSDQWTYHSTAVIASGDNFPDALAANGLAGYMTNEKLSVSDGANGAVPVILTKAGKLSTEAKDLLKNMQVQIVYIMGGTAAVSQDVEDAITNMGIGVTRVAGKDRQETSLKALQRINGNWKDRKGTYDLIIATGDNYADALSISPYAYRMGVPIILTKKDGTLTDEQVDAIKKNDKIAEIVIVGGTAAVSDTVMGQIGTLRDNGVGIHYTRLAGADRYETSQKIAEFEVAAWAEYYKSFNKYRDYKGSLWSFLGYDNGFTFDHVVVATGENFPDALAGGQLAGGVDYRHFFIDNVDGFEGEDWNPCPLLLTKDGDTRAEAEISKQLSDWRNDITVNDDYYFDEAEWDDFVALHYANTGVGSAYAELFGKWYTYATNWSGYGKKLAYEAFPFYVSLEAIADLDDTDKEVKSEIPITFTVTGFKADGKTPIIGDAASTSDMITDVKVKEVDGKQVIAFKFVGADYEYQLTVEDDIAQCKLNKDEAWGVTYKLIGDFVKIQDAGVREITLVGNKTIKGDDVTPSVIRYVAQDENFYGIILGGTAAVSNKKRDSLDDVVEATAGVRNYYELDDEILLPDRDFGVNIHYSRLIYDKTSGNVDYFKVAGTGDTVTHDNVTGVWTYVLD